MKRDSNTDGLLLREIFYQDVHFSVMYTVINIHPARKPIKSTKHKIKVRQQKDIKNLLTIYNLKILC